MAQQYKLSIKSRGDYLHVHASGVRTHATVTAITMQVFEAALDRGFPKVLVDVRQLEGRLGVLDSYLIVTQVFEQLRGKVLRKVVILDEQISSTRGRFIETVARNRGFNFRVFADLEEALTWLEA
jgi:hypothetical protein